MITVTVAHDLLQQHSQPTPVAWVPLSEAAGLVLARDIQAPADVPFFHQSAMDGYAFAYQHWQRQPLQVTAHIPAGNQQLHTLQPGQAARIYTGAPLPAGADTVVMQERTEQLQNRLFIIDEQLQPGSNVRTRGSEITCGTPALTAGSCLHPGAIGFLASLGIEKVPVYRRIKVTLIITGNELLQPGVPPAYARVYDSNSYLLTAALQALPVTQLATQYADDDVMAITAAIKAALLYSDLVLVTGGVSTGDYDFVVAAMQACEVTQVFHKIKQKPGKPLFMGRHQHQLLFGLPGNPASVLTCFYEYVLPAIDYMAGHTRHRIQPQQRVLTTAVHKKAGLTQFIKATCTATGVTPCAAQESYRLSSFATANCLLVLDEAVTSCPAGETVTVHLLPHYL